MLHKHYTLKLRVSFSQRKALHRPPLCDTRLQANDYNCAFFCCHSSFSKCSLALMKESRSLGTETISVDVFCLHIITDWKSHFRRNVFGNSKVKAQILPSPSCPHTLRPDIIIRQTTAGLYMQAKAALRFPCILSQHVWHLPLQGPLGARRWGRFTAGCLQRNEPRESFWKDSQRHFHNNK